MFIFVIFKVFAVPELIEAFMVNQGSETEPETKMFADGVTVKVPDVTDAILAVVVSGVVKAVSSKVKVIEPVAVAVMFHETAMLTI